MMRTLIESRTVLAGMASIAVGFAVLRRWPFPDENSLLQLVLFQKPWLLDGIKYAYIVMAFTTPFMVASTLASLEYIFLSRSGKGAVEPRLPPYPEPAGRQELFLVVGEIHRAKRPDPIEEPRWLTIPSRGLFTGIAIFGAIGTGKTSGCMIPFAEQILAYRATEPLKRIGGLVLEVKGDFCHKVRSLLKKLGREADYVEVSLDGPYRYNPLYNDLDAYALAFGIASLLNNLYGRGKEPFWQQAYTNLVKFIILLHKVLYDYVTLFDVYECAINPELMEQKIQAGERLFERRYLLITLDDFMADARLEQYPFERDGETHRMKALFSEELEAYLKDRKIGCESQIESGQSGGTSPGASRALNDEKRQQFEAVKRWFHHDWKRIDPRLRSSIVEGISVFLSLFDDNPAVKRVFCPPKEVYDPVANADGAFGCPLPPFRELIETGAVCALNFPVSANPGLAKVIGTLMKQDFQRALITRIPRMEREPMRHWREVLFLCDEYHSFATAGENDPTGDEKFFALSRQAKCIPIVATQSISSLRSTLPGETWRTLLQTFRTKIFLTLSDDFSARTASDLCGKEEQLKPSYTISENGQDAGVSVLTGRASAHRATLSASKSYHLQRDFTFEPKIFAELKNAQAIVLAYDGLNPHPPSYCYLKPYYLDRSRSYFEQLARGEL
jgi:TraM recognition site of TraD and TraG